MRDAQAWIGLRTGVSGLAAFAAAVLLQSGFHASAQISGATYPLQLTADRAAAFVEAHDRKLNYLPGEVLVRFKPGMRPVDQQRALMALRSRPSVAGLRWVGDMAVLTDRTQPDSRVLAEQLSGQPEVASAQPNYVHHILPMRVRAIAAATSDVRPQRAPNDPDYAGYQWNFSLINMPGALDINPGGSPSIIVATVDTGVTTAPQTLTFPLWTGTAFEHVPMAFAVSPELPASRLVSPHDFVFAAAGGAVVDMDGHATHVSSTIAEATNNNFALAGIAYNVKIMPVKACVGYWELMIARAQAGVIGLLDPSMANMCPDDAIVAGIEYAANNGAKVINLSLGGPDPDPLFQSEIQYAVQRGAFVAIAMGNDFETGNPVEYPAFYAASISGAMSVAAIGKSLTHAYYSNTGPHCEIAAPGGSDRDGGGLDQGFIWQETLLFTDQDPTVIRPRFDRYDEIGYIGTSMATPHIAGLAALIMSQSPGITPAAVEALIEKTARPCSLLNCNAATPPSGTVGRNPTFGFGLVQPRAALFGFGIIK
jgi:serine protease